MNFHCACLNDLFIQYVYPRGHEKPGNTSGIRPLMGLIDKNTLFSMCHF